MTPEILTVESRDFADRGRLMTAAGEIDHDSAGRLRTVLLEVVNATNLDRYLALFDDVETALHTV